MILIEESQPSSFNDLDRQTAVSPHIAAKRLFGAVANLGVPAKRTPRSQHSASRWAASGSNRECSRLKTNPLAGTGPTAIGWF